MTDDDFYYERKPGQRPPFDPTDEPLEIDPDSHDGCNLDPAVYPDHWRQHNQL